MVREDVRRFCRANGIRMSDSGSYYFELYGQKYRVSDHTENCTTLMGVRQT